MAKKFLIDEIEAQRILECFVEMPYKTVYQFCDILRNLDPAPDFSMQVKQYHDFIVQKGLWDAFMSYLRWTPEWEEAEKATVEVAKVGLIDGPPKEP